MLKKRPSVEVQFTAVHEKERRMKVVDVKKFASLWRVESF